MASNKRFEKEVFVNPVWKEDLEIYIAETNVPGLFIEAETLGEFEEIMFDVLPELIFENIVKPVLEAQGVKFTDGPEASSVKYKDIPASYPVVWGEGQAKRTVQLAVA